MDQYIDDLVVNYGISNTVVYIDDLVVNYGISNTVVLEIP